MPVGEGAVFLGRGSEARFPCSEASLGATHPGRGGRRAGRSALAVPGQREAQALLPLAEERGGPGAGGEACPGGALCPNRGDVPRALCRGVWKTRSPERGVPTLHSPGKG